MSIIKSIQLVSDDNKNGKFEIGDLVLYAPYYVDGDGSWIMNGDLGIVMDITSENEKQYQVVKVSWINSDNDTVDMCSDILKKINSEDLFE